MGRIWFTRAGAVPLEALRGVSTLLTLFEKDLLSELIIRAKTLVEKRIPDALDRHWLRALVKCYDNPEHGITLYVLEGSPPRGYVIVNHATKRVIAYDAADAHIKTYNVAAEWFKRYEAAPP